MSRIKFDVDDAVNIMINRNITVADDMMFRTLSPDQYAVIHKVDRIAYNKGIMVGWNACCDAFKKAAITIVVGGTLIGIGSYLLNKLEDDEEELVESES